MNIDKHTQINIGSALRHALANPFIAAAAFSALVHSAWSFSTFFSGAQPLVTADASAQFGEWLRQHMQLFGWLIPGLFIGFALDIGQINTSVEIRSGERHIMKYLTFIMFSLFTYALQWLYLTSHTPQVELGAGVPESMRASVESLSAFLRVWALPAALPAVTLLYTFSHTNKKEAQSEEADALAVVLRAQSVDVRKPEPPPVALPEHVTAAQAPDPIRVTPALRLGDEAVHVRSGASGGAKTGVTASAVTRVDDGYHAQCPSCEWSVLKDSEKSARNGLSSHIRYRHPELTRSGSK